MNNESMPEDDARRTAGEFELESGHERRQRLRGERMRKWRKETRRLRESEGDERTPAPLPRRFAP